MTEDTIKIKDTEITMYAGTLNELGKLVGLDKFGEIFENFETKQKILEILVRDRSCKNEVKYLLDIDMLTPKEYEDLLSWGVEHYSNFIKNSSGRMITPIKAMEAEIKGKM